MSCGLLWSSLLLCLMAAIKQTLATEVNIMSFNVRTSNGGDGHCNWNNRKQSAFQQVLSLLPDFVGMQEVTQNVQRPDFKAALAAQYHVIDKAAGHEYNLIFVKKDQWDIVSQGIFNLGTDPSGYGVRTVVYGRFKHKQTGAIVCHFNTHYATPGHVGFQQQSSNLITAKMKELCPGTDKLRVLTGDLNNSPGVSSIEILMKHLKQSVQGGTWCGGLTGASCTGTKFDYVLYKEAATSCLVKGESFRQKFTGSCFVSDHKVVMSKFCLEGSCCAKNKPVATPAPTNPPTSSPKPSSIPPDTKQNDETPTTGSNETNGTIQPNPLETKSAEKTEEKEKKDSVAEANTRAKANEESSSGATIGLVLAGVLMVVVGAVLGVVFYRKQQLRKNWEMQKDSENYRNSEFSLISEACILSDKPSII